MPLITVLRQSVRMDAVSSYERLVRFIAERAKQDGKTFKWTARISEGSEGRIISFLSPVEGYAELATREPIDAALRRLYGEADGEAVLTTLGEGIQSSSSQVLSPREDLSSQALPQPGQAPELVHVTRLRITPGGGLGCEQLIRQVVEAAAKVDEQRRYNVLQTVLGDLRTYAVVQAISDPAQLDRQAAVPELLAEAYGQERADAIFLEGTACIADAEAELSVLRPDLSNPAA